MEPNKSVEVPGENGETYTPGQRIILKILQFGAWTVAFIAMMYVMHS